MSLFIRRIQKLSKFLQELDCVLFKIGKCALRKVEGRASLIFQEE